MEQSVCIGYKIEMHIYKFQLWNLLYQTAALTMNQVINAATVGWVEKLGKENYSKIQENAVADLIAVIDNPHELQYLFTGVNL